MATLAIQTKLSVCDNQMRLLRSFRGCTLLCRIRATGICQFLFYWTILKAINWHCFYFDWHACDCTMIWLLFFLFFWKKELHDDVKEEHKLCNFELWTSLDKIHPFWISLKTLSMSCCRTLSISFQTNEVECRHFRTRKIHIFKKRFISIQNCNPSALIRNHPHFYSSIHSHYSVRCSSNKDCRLSSAIWSLRNA